MNASSNTTPKGLRGWWLTPPRHGMELLINPIAYRHLRIFGSMHIVSSGAAIIAGAICASYSAYAWAGLFLVIAALNLAGGSWYLSVARSAPARA